ncbi:MAG: eL32 family ribosomal protein [Candidatus Micrarchaeia archaeon]|jgi:large subunit ribosomal protein L32e
MATEKRKHPKFLRPNYGRSSRSRIKLAWRRPRGIDNKKRLKIKYMGESPSIGYRQPKAIRYHHPKGLPEVLVQTPADLEGLKNVVIRIAGSVGRLKRAAIEKLAGSMALHVVNVKKYAPFVKRIEKKDRLKAKDAAKKEDPSKRQAPAAAAEEKKDATKASPTIESTGKMSSQAVSQAQQSQKQRHDKQI